MMFVTSLACLISIHSLMRPYAFAADMQCGMHQFSSHSAEAQKFGSSESDEWVPGPQ